MDKKRILIIILVTMGLIGSVLGGYFLAQSNNSKPTITDFASCISAGHEVTGLEPRLCKTPEGRTYTEKVDLDKPDVKTDDDSVVIELKTREFISPKGVVVKLYNWAEKPIISSLVTITGEVPGNWSFEADFPVVLTDWDGKIIAQEPATLQGDWMTTDYVPFTVTLEFETPTVSKNGALILHKDNPSGLPQNVDAIEIPVTYK